MLSHPLLLKPGTLITYVIKNNFQFGTSFSNYPFYGVLIGRKIFGLSDTEAAFMLRRTWYQYDIKIGPSLAANAANTYTVQTVPDSEFYLWKMYATAALTQESIASTDMLVSLRDVTTNKNIFSSLAALRLVAGSNFWTPNNSRYQSGRGFSLTLPRLIKRNSTLALDIVNGNVATDAFPWHFTLEGVRVFDR